jgi:tetratricopeptide (TPR) repeat protein
MIKSFIVPYVMMILLFGISGGCAQLPRIVELHDPLTAREHFQLALAYEQKNENDLALREYHAVLEMKSFLGECYTNMANIYYKQGKEDLSESYYLKSIRANPHYGKAYNNLAWIYILKNRSLQRAEALLLEAIENDAHDAASYLDTLGFLYEKEGKQERALEVLLKAESIGFNGDVFTENEFLKHLEKLFIALDRKSDAETVHHRIVELKSQNREKLPLPEHEEIPRP